MTHTSLQALILPRALRGGDAPGMRLLIGEAPPDPEILIPVPVPSPDHPHIITAVFAEDLRSPVLMPASP